MNSKRAALIKFGLAIALLIVAYFPTIKWMVYRWGYAESYYNHGFLIPLISLFLIWKKRGVLSRLKLSSHAPGLWVAALCLIINII